MFSISKFLLIGIFCIFPVLSIVNSSLAFGSIMKSWTNPSSFARADICDKTVEIAHISSSSSSLPDTSTPSTPPSNGNCTNNLTVQNTITNHPIAADEIENEEAHDVDATTKQPIATFDEWTKEKLKQEQLKASATVPAVILGSGSAPKAEILVSSQSTRNYASKECGAKVITSNAEAENTKALLNDKEKDEYMRNPCSKAENKFVVIELCETIQPRLIELGNFELFSSGPREVKIWGTERFPNSEWELVAELNATDTRHLQTFVLHTRVYSKFIKLELVSHYGNEHYCTLSVLKVLGMSMADEYEIEAQAAVRLPVISEVVQQPNEKITPATEELKEADKPIITVSEAEVNENVVTEPPKPIPQSTFLPMNSSALEVGGKRRLSAFDVHLCRVCPTSPSCIVPTHLCWVFVWRPPPTTKKSKFVSPPLIPEDRSVSLRLRRQRYSNLHRMYVEATKGLRSKSNQHGASNVPQNENIQEQTSQQKNKKEKKGIKKAAQDVPAASISAKESVFLKLNKRIAALELNMSLSSEYLSELSRQYVAQADEHHKHIEQAKKAAQDVASDVERRLNQTIVEKVLSMRKEMDSLLASLRVAAFSFAVSPARTQDSYQDTLRNSDYVEEQPESESTELKEYYSFADSDGIWTTEQVVYTVVAVQIFTVLAIVPILICYINLMKQPTISEEDLEELIQKKIERTMLEQSDKMKPEKVETESLAQHIREKKKMKRIRQRDRLRQSLNSLDEQRFSDTTISRAASQTETSSEAEIPRSIIRGVVSLCQPPPLRSNA
ncbi:unnamed protein product [Auanema sp. JU1783]|nr:unnamed protein product [Auanema sp. JU1783]